MCNGCLRQIHRKNCSFLRNRLTALELEKLTEVLESQHATNQHKFSKHLLQGFIIPSFVFWNPFVYGIKQLKIFFHGINCGYSTQSKCCNINFSPGRCQFFTSQLSCHWNQLYYQAGMVQWFLFLIYLNIQSKNEEVILKCRSED